MITIKEKLSKKAENIKFNLEKHKYLLNNKELISVTTLIDLYTPKFDPQGIITARKALEKGITPREQARLWEEQSKEACVKGTETHLIAQQLLEGTYAYPQDANVDLNAKLKVLQPVCEELKPYLIACEQVIYNEKLGIAGTIDLLTLYNNKIDIWDWKTNSKPIIIDKYYEMMLPPLQHLPHNNYYKYALQLSLYRYLLELEEYNMGNLGLLHIKKNNMDKIMLPNLREEVILMLEDYKKKKEMIINKEII